MLAESATQGEAVCDGGRSVLRACGGEVHHRRAAGARAARRQRPRAGAPAAVAARPRAVQQAYSREGIHKETKVRILIC